MNVAANELMHISGESESRATETDKAHGNREDC